MHNRNLSNRQGAHGLDYGVSEKTSALGYVSSQEVGCASLSKDGRLLKIRYCRQDHELFAIPSTSQQERCSKPASSLARRGGHLLLLVCSGYLLYRTYAASYGSTATTFETPIQPSTPYTPYHAITSPYFLKDNWPHGKSDDRWQEVQSWGYDGRTRIEQGRERELDTCLTYEVSLADTSRFCRFRY